MDIYESPPASLTVAEFARLVRLTVEKGLPSCWVEGEISNLLKATSGHWYFTIKDPGAGIRCVMFKTRNQFVDWKLREGDHIEIRAQASFYETRGEFQLVVDALRPFGQGNLFAAFMQLKDKLTKEGLFQIERKKPLPKFASKIGIITSLQAAALRDVLITIQQRWPIAKILIYPCAVQGINAARQIADSISAANMRNEVDVLLLVRGGGSLEDLLPFNNEDVARAISNSSIPLVCGVGHETDFTISDFVADIRAATPTAAAQASTPDKTEQISRLAQLSRRLNMSFTQKRLSLAQSLDETTIRMLHPKQIVARQRVQVDQSVKSLSLYLRSTLAASGKQYEILNNKIRYLRPRTENQLHLVTLLHSRLRHVAKSHVAKIKQNLNQRQQGLNLLCPDHVLERGYAIVRNSCGEILSSPEQFKTNDAINIELSKCTVIASVIRRG